MLDLQIERRKRLSVDEARQMHSDGGLGEPAYRILIIVRSLDIVGDELATNEVRVAVTDSPYFPDPMAESIAAC